jgi:hypothetical protein
MNEAGPVRAAAAPIAVAQPFDRRLPAVAAPILVAAALVNIHAALALRGYFADGSYWLVEMISRGGFFLQEEARLAADFLEELPTALALGLGISSVHSLGVVWGLTLHLLPLVFVAGCYAALPKRSKSLFVYPLFFYLAGVQASAFAAIAAGATAAGYFWLLLILIIYHGKGPWGFAALAAASLPALYAHEVMVMLAPVLAVAAAWRGRCARTAWARLGFAAMAVWFVVVAARQIGFTLYPRDALNRDLFIEAMVKGRFVATRQGINAPTLLGLAAAALLPGLLLTRRAATQAAALAGFALLAAATALGPLWWDFLFRPTLQFEARYYGAFLSVPLAAGLMVSNCRPALCALWAKTPLLCLLLLLAAGQFGWQVSGTCSWSRWLEAWQAVLGSHRGLVPWPAAEPELAVRLPPTDDDPTAKWIAFGWTFPSLSLLLAPDGRVQAVIGAPSVPWQPFDPADPATLPRSPLFDTSAYRTALAR